MQGGPTGSGAAARTWRRRVAAAAAGAAPADGVVLAFTVAATRWVDLDTLAEETLAGLRDAGVWRRGFGGLDALLATRRDGTDPGAVIEPIAAAALRRRRPPGPVALDATGKKVPRPGAIAGKRAWRRRLADVWSGRPALTADVWADLELDVGGSLLGPLEPALDALEPVLGRDPRGRQWQEFFPNDHVIRWLRVRRARAGAPALRLRLGPIDRGQAIDSGGASPPRRSPRAHDQA